MPLNSRQRQLPSPPVQVFKPAAYLALLVLGLLPFIALSPLHNIFPRLSSRQLYGNNINKLPERHAHRRLLLADNDDASALTTTKESTNKSTSWGVDKKEVNAILGIGTGRPRAPNTAKLNGSANPLLFPRPALAFKGTSPLLFTCPDGRKGLHVVHTRLMLNMITARGAKGTFRAGRMLLFRDFSLASLARQTVQNFVYYVSYDHAQDFPFLDSCHDILKYRMVHGASFLYLPERGFSYTVKAHMMLDFTRVQELLIQHKLATEEELSAVQLYITSRLDSDDAGNIDSIRLTQQQACSTVGPKHTDRILLTYIEPKLFWLPDSRQPYGQLASIPKDGTEEEIWKNTRAMRYRPVMQSLTIDQTLLKCTTPINCYSHQHYQPSYIVFARNETDCPFDFEWHRNYYLIKPENNAVGGLYSRTPGSWYAERNNKGYYFLDFDVKALSDCGVDPGELASTNIMLGMLYQEASEAASMSADAARGFGGIGAFATWKKKKDILTKTDRAFNETLVTMNSTLRAFFRGAVRSYMYGSRWRYGQEIDYRKIAAEVKRNFTRYGAKYFEEDDEFQDDEG